VVEHAAGRERGNQERERVAVRAEPAPAVREAEELEGELCAPRGCGPGDDAVDQRRVEGGREQADRVLQPRRPRPPPDHVQDRLVEWLLAPGRVRGRRRRGDRRRRRLIRRLLRRDLDGQGWGLDGRGWDLVGGRGSA